MRIFITGATGYIGGALTKRLVAEGHEVRALVRPTSRTADLAALGVALFEGDVTERVSMREAMSGADWVVHAAAQLDFGVSEESMYAVNVGGSENVATLAWKLGVGRLLSVSSIAYFGGSPADGSAATEETPPLPRLDTTYSRTKHAGERAVRAVAEQGLRVNTVYPSLVYGAPGKKSGANALLRNLVKERMPLLVGGDRRVSWVHLDDVVDGIVRVMEHSQPGPAYLLSGDMATVSQLAEKLAVLGIEPPRRELSVGMALLVARLLAPIFRLRGRRTPLLPEHIRSLAHHWNFDDTKARRELRWQPRTLDEGLPSTVEYLRST